MLGRVVVGVLLLSVTAHDTCNALEAFASSARVASSLDPQVLLSASQALLPRSGSRVDVFWSGVASPTYLDFVALHVVQGDATPSSSESLPGPLVKFQLTGGTANGTLSFTLLNLRASLRFVYYTGELAAPVALAATQDLVFADFNEPTAVRLSLGDDEGGLRVSWTTHNATAPAIRWGAIIMLFAQSCVFHMLLTTRRNALLCR